MKKEISKEDKKHRMNVLTFVVFAVVAGIALIEWLLPLGADFLLKKANSEITLKVMEAILALIFLCVIPVVFYLFALGRRTVNRGRISPHGTKVKHDMSFDRGHKTAMRSQMLVFISILLIIFGLLGWILIHYAVESLYGR